MSVLLSSALLLLIDRMPRGTRPKGYERVSNTSDVKLRDVDEARSDYLADPTRAEAIRDRPFTASPHSASRRETEASRS